MAVGTTYTFDSSRNELIFDALANVGASGPGKTPRPDQIAHAARVLNRIVKGLDPDGLYLWRNLRRTATTTAATDSFSTAADVLSIDEPMSYLPAADATGRTPITPMTADEYRSLPDRTTAGRPTRYFSEMATGPNAALKVYLWPVPDTSSDTIEYGALIRSFDYSTAASTSDFPSSWNSCLLYGLSSDLAPSYGQAPLAAYFRGLFNEEKARLMASQGETGNLTLVAFGRSY